MRKIRNWLNWRNRLYPRLAALCERLAQRLQEMSWRLDPDYGDGARFDRLWGAIARAGHEDKVMEIEELIGRSLGEEELRHYLDQMHAA